LITIKRVNYLNLTAKKRDLIEYNYITIVNNANDRNYNKIPYKNTYKKNLNIIFKKRYNAAGYFLFLSIYKLVK